MYPFKRLAAAVSCTCIITTASAFHYSVYRSVPSTGYEPELLQAKHVLQQQEIRNDIVNVDKSATILLANPNNTQLSPLVLQNPYRTAIQINSVSTPKNNLIQLIPQSCGKQLASHQQCAYQVQYIGLAQQQHMQKQIVPITIHYQKQGQQFAITKNILLVQVPKHTFIKAPVETKPEPLGFGSNYIKALYIDQHGRLYLGTHGGLSEAMNDQELFFNKTSLNGLGNNLVNAIVKDPSGNIYVGTKGAGLAISTNHGLTFDNITVKNGLAGNTVKSLYWHNGRLFVGTNHGLSESNDGGHSFSNKGTMNGLDSYVINQIQGDHAGHLFLATDNGIAESDDGGASFYNISISNGLGDNAVNAIAVDRNNHIYAATENGLSISNNDGQSFKNYQTNSGLPSARILSVAVAPWDNRLYVGTDCGLSTKSESEQQFTNLTHTQCAANQMINSIAVNPFTKRIYFATAGNGLGVVTNDTNVQHRFETQMVADNLLSGVWDNNNKLYVGTASGLSHSVDLKHFQTWAKQNGLANDTVHSFYSDAPNNLYIGTNQGLDISHDDGKTFQLVLKGDDIQSIAKNAAANQLFIGTQRGLFVSQDDGAHVIQHTMDDGLGDDSINTLAYDPVNHVLYAATAGGLSISKDAGQTFKNLKFQHYLGSPDINAVTVNPQGGVYVGTPNGLLIGHWAGNALQWQDVTTNYGLASNDVESLYYAPSTQQLIAGSHGALSISDDGGLHFTAITDGLQHKRIIGETVGDHGHIIYAASRNHGLWQAYQ